MVIGLHNTGEFQNYSEDVPEKVWQPLWIVKGQKVLRFLRFEHKHFFCCSQFSLALTVLVATLWWCKAADCRVEMCCRGLVWCLWHCGHHKHLLIITSPQVHIKCAIWDRAIFFKYNRFCAISAFLQLIWQTWTTEKLK